MSFTSLSRRELLAAFLSAPAVLAAGCGAPVLPLQGEIVGASHAAGHRLRESARPRPDASRWKQTEVIIVGAGVAGLSAAWKLRSHGIEDFLLLELEPDAGGTSRSGESTVASFPWGAHYLPLPMRENAPLAQLLNEIGVLEGVDDDGEPIAGEQFLCRDPEERLFVGGQWHEGLFPKDVATADDTAQLARFRKEIDRWVAFRDARGRRAFALPSALSSDDAEVTALDRMTMAEWLDQHRLTSTRLRWLVDYACRDDYGLTASQASAWAGLFYFASRVRKAGDEARPLLTWPEGNGRLVRHLADRAGPRILKDHVVLEVREDDADGVVEVVALRNGASTTGDYLGFRAPHVLFAAPQFVAAHAIRGYRAARPSIADFDYGSWMVANLHLKGRPPSRGFPLCWDNVLADSPSLGYVVATHQRGIDVGPTVFTYYYPLCDDDPKAARTRLLELEWQHWADVCLADLEPAHPDIRRLAERIDVMRWGHAMIRPKPGFVWGAARRASLEPFGRIHFAHSDLSGVALFEEAFHHGCRAADEIAQRRSS